MAPTRTFVTTVALTGLLVGCSSSGAPSTTSDSASGLPAAPTPATSAVFPVSAEEAWIVYREFGSTQRLRLVRPDGSDDHRILPDRPFGDQSEPDWSPDGQLIAFTLYTPSPSGPPRAVPWVVAPDGSNARPLARCSSPCQLVTSPDWSPDGRHLAIIRYDMESAEDWGRTALEVLDAATGERSVVVETPDALTAFYDPQWSPDGESIAVLVEAYPDARQMEVTSKVLAVVPVAGGAAADLRIVSDPREFAHEPDWAPADRILYAATTSANPIDARDVVTVAADGASPRRITSSQTGLKLMTDPVWTPDGQRLQVVEIDGAAGTHTLSTMDPDGTDVKSQPWSLLEGGSSPRSFAQPRPQPDQHE